MSVRVKARRSRVADLKSAHHSLQLSKIAPTFYNSVYNPLDISNASRVGAAKGGP
jgi:hypothetical protein